MAEASDEKECIVCTNHFTTPKILPCGHLLCRQCVISWMDSNPDAGCPLCRCPIVEPGHHSHRKPVNVADALPTDLVMEAVVQSAGVLAQDPNCRACEEGKADFICLQCLDMMCISCAR
ncbi:hypothetical protein C0Q70_17815 [Pomacea canaliculata]|uniref:RING-type domain-containing protein n=1 Tax=Pomacea canaliculata TaxID=400727 RepID=A0A2T7NLG9_POMCA|nr:hypothetical protein C0Q70_17815 [Pomacea canaliculata]